MAMKLYYYGQPAGTLVRWCLRVREQWRWTRHLLAARIVLAWALLIPPAWLLVKLGNLGHGIAGWCGLDSREW